MKKIQTLIIIAIVLIALLRVNGALASWYAGSERIPTANGVHALISTSQDPLDLVEVNSSGVSNWVSTYDTDANGRDWLQAGWKYYHWYSIPKQYVEWCIDCDGIQGTYEMKDQFANQDWGTTIDYWVSRQAGSRWCAYTAGVVRFCVDNLHNAPVRILAKSEVHDSYRNPLDTIFNEVRYKEPTDNMWRLFDNQRVCGGDFPYDVQIFSNSHFRTCRIATEDVFLPIITK